jgi:hypothetical protein
MGRSLLVIVILIGDDTRFLKLEEYSCQGINSLNESLLSRTRSSRPGELPPQSLTEPYVIVSHHTALQLIISKQILPHLQLSA